MRREGKDSLGPRKGEGPGWGQAQAGGGAVRRKSLEGMSPEKGAGAGQGPERGRGGRPGWEDAGSSARRGRGE